MKNEFNLLSSCLENLSEETQPNWGRMNCSEMINHCNNFIDVSMGVQKVGLRSKLFGKLFGKWFLNSLKKKNFQINRFPKNSPTLKEFKSQKNSINFNDEKDKLRENLETVNGLKTQFMHHQIYGNISTALFKKLIYFHTSYHFNQFGVLNE